MKRLWEAAVQNIPKMMRRRISLPGTAGLRIKKKGKRKRVAKKS
jgi:hypothetical protein